MVTIRVTVVLMFEKRGLEDEVEIFVSSFSVQDDGFLCSCLAVRLRDGYDTSFLSQISSIFLFLASVPGLLFPSQSGVGTKQP